MYLAGAFLIASIGAVVGYVHIGRAVVCGVVAVILLALIQIRRIMVRQGALLGQREGPLKGVRVVDLSVVLAGPWATAQMAELGAEVVKVECVALPDTARGLGHAPVRGMAGVFVSAGRGKQSIVLDLKHPKGMEAFKRLVKQADVLVQNYRPGAVERMGIDYDTLKKDNPQIIYVSSSGYGPSGPSSGDRIYDPVIQAVSGATDGCKDNKTGHYKLFGQAVFDKATALTSAQAILAALLARERGAGGQHIQIRMLDASFQWMWGDMFANFVWDGEEKKAGDVSMSDMYGETAASAVPQETLSLNPQTRLQTTEFQQHLQPTRRHILFGCYRAPIHPIVFEENPPNLAPAPPMLGEHTRKILREVGYNHSEINEMLAKGAACSTASLLKALPKKAKVFKLLEKVQTGNTFGLPRKPGATLPRQKVANPPALPLKGFNVLELGSFVAVPFAAMMLADQGASVVKLEREGHEDRSRKWGPGPNGMSGLFTTLNRNKRGALLKCDEEGKENLKSLITQTHVVLIDEDEETAWGLTKALVETWNPKAIYGRMVKGQGECHAQALSGMTYNEPPPRQSADSPDLPGQYCRSPVCEKASAYYLAMGVCASLLEQVRTQRRETFTVSLQQTAVHFGFSDLFWSNVWVKDAPGFPKLSDMFQLPRCADGTYVFTCALSDKEWGGFKEVFGHHISGKWEEKVKSGQWDTLPGRLGDVFDYWNMIKEVVEKYTRSEIKEKAKQADMMFGVALSMEEALDDPQTKHNNIVQSVDHGEYGVAKLARPAARFHGTPEIPIITPAPTPGQHTTSVLDGSWALSG